MAAIRLLNTMQIASSSAALAERLHQQGEEYVELGLTEGYVPLPWLACFRPEDLPTAAGASLLQVPLERALENLAQTLPAFARMAGDANLARAYWQEAIAQLRRLPLPWLSLDVGDWPTQPLLGAALKGQEQALLALTAFQRGAPPLPLAEFRSSKVLAADATRLANSVAMAWSGAQPEAWAWWTRLPAAAPDGRSVVAQSRPAPVPHLSVEFAAGVMERLAVNRRLIRRLTLQAHSKPVRPWWQLSSGPLAPWGWLLISLALFTLLLGTPHLLTTWGLVLTGMVLLFVRPERLRP